MQEVEVSMEAFKLWGLIAERAARYTIEDAQRELKLSKAAIYRAVAELEEAGIITVVEE